MITEFNETAIQIENMAPNPPSNNGHFMIGIDFHIVDSGFLAIKVGGQGASMWVRENGNELGFVSTNPGNEKEKEVKKWIINL